MSSFYNLKLLTAGDGAVGKTTLLMSYAFQYCPHQRHIIPAVFVDWAGAVKVDGVNVRMDLWDVRGGEGYERLNSLSYPGTDVFLLCFALDAPFSFANVKRMVVP